MIEESGNQHKFFYPPGGILIWIIIYLELLTFGAALAVMAFYSRDEPGLFHASRMQLNVHIGCAKYGCFIMQRIFYGKSNGKGKAGVE